MSKIYATRNPKISEREQRNMKRARAIAAQGMVLLENNGILPLQDKSGNIALYGNGARCTIKGGTGSGDVNSRFVVNVEQGLEEAGFTITTKPWLDAYDQALAAAKGAYFSEIKEAFATEGQGAIMKLFNEPFVEPPIVPITEADTSSSTAVYVIARNSGEGKDRKPTAGDYELFDEEKDAITMLAESYEKFIVVLNVGGVMDTKFLRSTKGIDAILLMSQAGNIGGHALADVLIGKVTPSGHLTTTWAQDYSDYPSASQFSHMNGDIHDEFYNEGIYVGYRYFDTFGVAPAYPFGYGKSYTDFDLQVDSIKADSETVSIEVTVTNVGDTYSGKEVVQVYYSAPSGSLEKPYQELAAYKKTKELAPGEKQTVSLSYPVNSMASYDEARASYVLEAGSYFVRVGTHSRDTSIAATILIDQEVVTEVLSNRFPLDCELNQLSSKGATSFSYDTETDEIEAAKQITIHTKDIKCKTISYITENTEIAPTNHSEKITMDDIKSGKFTLDELVGQLTVEEMALLCVGTSRGGFGGTSIIGSASAVCPGAAGDTTSCMIDDRNIRNMILADGPAGLRLSRTFAADKEGNLIAGSAEAPIPGLEFLMPDNKPEIPEDAIHYYQYCTAIPIATLLAQTWDMDIIEEAGDIIGEEMNELGITLWLAPGMNIHRNPLCGRNFEYFSEDPLVSGMCACAETIGVQKHPGVGTTIKHFAFNNQEDNRMHTNAHIGERAIREIYLKGFEITVKESQPMSIMSSYNLANGIHTANSYDLLTAIARQEWGFEGIVMTDWGTTGGMMKPQTELKYGDSSAAECVRTGNDLVMPGKQEDVDDIIRAVEDPEEKLTLADLQTCAKRILNIILQSSVYEDAAPYYTVS